MVINNKKNILKVAQKKKKEKTIICNEPHEITIRRSASFKDASSHEKFP